MARCGTGARRCGGVLGEESGKYGLSTSIGLEPSFALLLRSIRAFSKAEGLEEVAGSFSERPAMKGEESWDEAGVRFRECVEDGGEITCAGARGVATSSVFMRELKIPRFEKKFLAKARQKGNYLGWLCGRKVAAKKDGPLSLCECCPRMLAMYATYASGVSGGRAETAFRTNRGLYRSASFHFRTFKNTTYTAEHSRRIRGHERRGQ